MDLLRQLQRKRNVRAVEETPWMPSEMGEENQASRELAGDIATALGTWGNGCAGLSHLSHQDASSMEHR